MGEEECKFEKKPEKDLVRVPNSSERAIVFVILREEEFGVWACKD